jgi:hypothetical protein
LIDGFLTGWDMNISCKNTDVTNKECGYFVLQDCQWPVNRWLVLFSCAILMEA